MSDTKHPQLPILLIDDEEQFLFSMKMTLSSQGYNNIVECKNSREVMKLLDKNDFSVIVMDIMMPHKSGTEFNIVYYSGMFGYFSAFRPACSTNLWNRMNTICATLLKIPPYPIAVKLRQFRAIFTY